MSGLSLLLDNQPDWNFNKISFSRLGDAHRIPSSIVTHKCACRCKGNRNNLINNMRLAICMPNAQNVLMKLVETKHLFGMGALDL